VALKEDLERAFVTLYVEANEFSVLEHPRLGGT
jgi:hypothetical protein